MDLGRRLVDHIPLTRGFTRKAVRQVYSHQKVISRKA